MANRTEPKLARPIDFTEKNKINRGRELRRDTDDYKKNYSVSLMDHDAAVMYYFNQVIRPTVEENGNQVKVPIMYANPERWASVRKSGHMVDRNKKRIIPVIAFRRVSIEKDPNYVIDKLDANKPTFTYQFQKKYSKNNRYDLLSAMNGSLGEQREFHSVTMPDYMIMNYEAIVWTNFTDQMNRIIEKINFSDGSYWGEPGKFKFRASIDSFQDASEYEQERLIRTNFSFTFNGYLLPEEFNGVSNTQRGFSPKYISFGTETTLDINSRVRSVESDKSDGSGYNFNTPSIVNQS
tara:strand:- start:1248 stop:2129 length:882 start_codon:yes stop_codon:yes gene_type:complete